MRTLRRTDAETDLTRYADGLAWRLKRGRDFQGSVGAFRRTVKGIAKELGKSVQAVPDKLQPDKYIWVQFGEGTVVEGEPCPRCGSDAIERTARYWARCADCRAQLVIVPPDPVAAPVQAAAETALDTFAAVVLHHHRIEDDVEHCFGTGVTATGERVVLAVDFPLEDGSRMPHVSAPDQWQYTLHVFAESHFEPVLDLADVEDAPVVSWRISEDPGPAPSIAPEPAPS